MSQQELQGLSVVTLTGQVESCLTSPGYSVDGSDQEESLHTAGAVPPGGRVKSSPAVLSPGQGVGA